MKKKLISKCQHGKKVKNLNSQLLGLGIGLGLLPGLNYNLTRRYLSPRIMTLGEKWSGINGGDRNKAIYENPTFGETFINTYRKNIPQITYLMSEEDQKNAFLNSGYIEGNKGDYGLVKKAVGDRYLPVYQKNPDIISRDSLEHVGNYLVKGDNDFIQEHLTENKFTSLENAASYPVAIYVNKHNRNKKYFKGWDLNDYGVDKQGNRGFRYKGIYNYLANFVDKIGNPVVVTTGYQQLTSEAYFNNAVLNVYNTDKEKYEELMDNGTFKYDEKRMEDLYERYIGAEAMPYLWKNAPEKAEEIIKADYSQKERHNKLKEIIPYQYFKNNINSLYSKEMQILNGVFLP